MLRNMISYSLAGIRKLKVNTFATQTKPLLIFDAIAHASSMRHRCCPFSSTALHLRRRRSRFIY